MRVLALDVASRTGWASGDRYGVRDFPLRRGSSPGIRFLEFQTWVRRLIEATDPEVVVYEMAHHRGGAATELCVGFTTRVMQEAAAAGIEYHGCHSRMLKAFATGNGNADKEAMLAAARQRWPELKIESDDLADALLLHAWAEAGFPDRVAERKAAERAAVSARKAARTAEAERKRLARVAAQQARAGRQGAGSR